jgi:hypothetical protein
MPAKIARSTPRPSFGLPSDGHRRSVDVRKEVMDQSCAGQSSRSSVRLSRHGGDQRQCGRTKFDLRL